ncbi:recombinase family protein [Streptomyces coffeae]|uniref:Recombinase family protein n=1 Tax=Streptomyces coffeae TaxID=621382 RepID=A0ABS1N9F5_9ACTN|nr:recombinase family protein [Streptomyces coffeae]MBL1096709.1 recombinase family protein [Streptomyces coffeae]
MDDGKRAIAYIYDREITSADNADPRITICRAYAAELGWQVAGQWVDRGENAVSPRRRAWVGMLAAMEHEAQGAQPVCLVASWDRIARDDMVRAELRQMVSKIDGVCVSVVDGMSEDDFSSAVRHV